MNEKLVASAFFEKPLVAALVADADISYISIRVLLWLVTKDQDHVIDVNSLEDLARDVALRQSGLTGEVFNFLYILKKQKAPKCLPYTFRGSTVEFSGRSRVLQTDMSVLEIDQLSILVRMYTPEEALSKDILHKRWYEKRLRCLARRFHRRLTEVQFIEMILRKHQKRKDKGVLLYRPGTNFWISVEYGEQLESEDDIRNAYLLGTRRAYETLTRLPRMCDFCGSVDECDRKHLRCAKCRTASYCSRACQTLHWCHREKCTPFPSPRESFNQPRKMKSLFN
jgi:hypothetical protein